MRPRRGRPRARRAAVVGTALVLLAALVYVPLTLLSPVAPEAAVVSTYSAPTQPGAELAFPGYGATGVQAVGWDESLTTSGQTAPLPIASISKVVTALVVLDAHPLDGGDGPTLTLGADDVALYESYRAVGGKVAPMTLGQQLTEKQVLQVALIESANNYADALARWAFGDTASFVAAATSWLSENGLTSTTLVEPTGMSPANTSTPVDLVRLGELALAEPDVAGVVGTAATTVPGVGEIENSNELLGLDGVVGIKTGTLDEAGAFLLFAADYTIAGQPVTVVGVMLGGVDHDSLDADVQRLLASVTTKFQTVTATRAGDSYASYELPWGARAEAVAAGDASALVWGDVDVTAAVVTDEVSADPAGAEVGSVRFEIGDHEVEVPLVLDRAVPEPGAWWRLTHPADVVG